jgi:hypothetical protein
MFEGFKPFEELTDKEKRQILTIPGKAREITGERLRGSDLANQNGPLSVIWECRFIRP